MEEESEEFELSPSKRGTYDDCGWWFNLKYIEKIEPEEGDDTTMMDFGTGFHATFENFHDYIDRDYLLEAKISEIREYFLRIIERFDLRSTEELQPKVFRQYIVLFVNNETRRLKVLFKDHEKREDALEHYFPVAKELWVRSPILKFRGYIDFVTLLSKSDEAIFGAGCDHCKALGDYKIKWDPKKAPKTLPAKTAKQLTEYGLVCNVEDIFGEQIRYTFAYYFPSGVYPRILTDRILDNARQRIEILHQKIRDRIFPKPRTDYICRYCPYHYNECEGP